MSPWAHQEVGNIMGFISLDGGYYYEGDRQGQDLVVPDRPDHTYAWDGEKWVRDLAVVLQEIREERKNLLEEADHRINWLEDNGLNSETARQYRQQLRDMTQGLDPDAVSWPNKPW